MLALSSTFAFCRASVTNHFASVWVQNCETFSADDKVWPASTNAFNLLGGGIGLKILLRSSSGNGSSPESSNLEKLKHAHFRQKHET